MAICVYYVFTHVTFLFLPLSLGSILVGDKKFQMTWLIFFLTLGKLVHQDNAGPRTMQLKNEMGAPLARKPGGQHTAEEQKTSVPFPLRSHPGACSLAQK